jgi:SWI/SNF-related matrix-associated actin-dependent regulator of chromatin subfamily A member 5
MKEEKHGAQNQTIFRESPSFIQNGTMRDYQVQGLNWLVSLHENGISGILADEMGLGKTLQTISFIGYLRHICDISGPHLVAVPKSTLDNWKREFEKWIPEINVLVLKGDKDERKDIINSRLIDEQFDVCITSYELLLIEKSHLKKFAWEYIIIDEAHRIKNENSSLASNLRQFSSRNRLLITGTPLQNNLHELWALLNFLLPDVFSEPEVFDQWVSRQEEGEDSVIQQLHRVLRPFLLRRIKSDVEKSLLPKKEVVLPIPMSDMQVKWYKKILEKDIDAVNNAAGKRESKTRLLNIVMQLKKCCNHPYLFDGAEPGPPYTQEAHIINNAGKMIMLDKLLDRLQKQGSRVLIFSQMSRMLDILEDYCIFLKGHKYCRIDGGTAHEDRIAAIDEFNKPDSEKFVFLLTTRAGGLGINLTSADIVILFDSDWNPQADLQAMDRAHRIGQTKQVVVYRFVTQESVEEKVLERAAQKLRLDQLVIQQGRAQQVAKAQASKEELLNMIQHGADQVLRRQANSAKGEIGDDEFDELLKKGEERTAELNAKYEKLGIDDLQNFSSENAFQWNGQDFTARPKVDIGMTWIEPGKRERKEQAYSIDKYYRNALATGGRTADTKPKAPRAPKQVAIHDWQFFPEGLDALQQKETNYYRKEIGYKVPPPDETTGTDKEEEPALNQADIDNAEPLTEEERQQKEEWIEEGFGNWNRRDFQQFINGCAKYGKDNFKMIAEEVDSKAPDEIKEYAAVFWERKNEIQDIEKHLANIAAGDEKRKKLEKERKALDKKIKDCRVPLQQLKINYSVSTTNKKVYTEEEDRFILVQLHKHGIDTEGVHERIRDEIRESPLFRFDWFFLSRTPIEIGRRCATLLTAVLKEYEDNKTNGIKGRAREESDDEDENGTPPKKKTKNNLKNKPLDSVKGGKGSKASTTQTSRAASVASTASATKTKAKPKGKKK